ncbi:related to Suppressor of glycerol defect protein 1 [Saccharomycodes ludwigii]|uniref:Related to Suppressor of glycerol defect protein 1 n=1 Tax=Saccharomycodes ludwigii TaxID=36035 RepID=A0A376B3P6_9ASCO|nr:hypothetical protein SCDLUD_000636 [Saccharomycodes ludwigii]KAH3903028.1 hypothetical protein SCDLUD_000636 [Saccharomycodes ludwigii]SSD59293.1 related to Suppressor of glycerol defect protein 1 [Saccharomycodes ludwigii]
MKSHSIRLPGSILDELKKNTLDDPRFQNQKSKKRGRSQTLSRKERRKQQRSEKKRKATIRGLAGEDNKKSKHDHTSGLENARGKNKFPKKKSDHINYKNSIKTSEKISTDSPISSDDSLGFEDFSKSDLSSEEWEQLKDFEADGKDNSLDETLSAEETMRRLIELKKKKNSGSVGSTISRKEENEYTSEGEFDSDTDQIQDLTAAETMELLKKLKEKKKNGINKSPEIHKKNGKGVKNATEEKELHILTPQERAQIERDEIDMKYYAKKLGLKKNKKKIHARDDYDAIGGLLEGLDFFENYGASDDDYGEFELTNKNTTTAESSGAEETKSDYSSEENLDPPFSSDDELSSGDFDEFDEGDLDSEEWEQLKELEGSDLGGSDYEREKNKKKENPYVAPGTAQSNDNDEDDYQENTYIPPSLRKKVHLESTVDEKLRKQIKSSLNKLSESNIIIIISSINEMYNSNPHQILNDSFTHQVIETISTPNKLLDKFVLNYAGVAFALWKLQGIEMGASFIQSIVEDFLKHFKSDNVDKSEEGQTFSKCCSNILTLISYCYDFGIISSNLVYNIMQLLIAKPTQFATELLLRIISVCGPMVRSGDPATLKEIIITLMGNVKGLEQTSKMKFLLETVSDLKNNRLKTSLLAPSYVNLKKLLVGSLKLTSTTDPLQVSLSDIENVDKKGKWWLVGASWKGNASSAFENNDTADNAYDIVDMNIGDNFLDEIPDLGSLAKEQRMNTEVRKSIFVSIMGAQDFMDAFTKIEKLNLKNKQSLEIPKVLIHCLTVDGNGYNPYYSLLAKKLCEYNHNILKGLQFQFWNIVKKFENDKGALSDDEDEDDHGIYSNDETTSLKRISAQARFYGFLLGSGILKIDIFKHVTLLGGLNADGMVFFELVLYQLFLTLGKNAEKKVIVNHKKVYEYDDSDLVRCFISNIKSENISVVLKGLQWFLSKKFKPLQFLIEFKSKKNYKRVEERFNWAYKTALNTISKKLEQTDY